MEAIESAAEEREGYLWVADTLESFRDRLRALAEAEAILQRMCSHPHRVPLKWASSKHMRNVIAALTYQKEEDALCAKRGQR